MAKVRKLPNGRYQLNYINSAGTRARRNFRTWREANSAKIEVEGKIARGVDRPQGDELRLRDLLDSYAAHLTAREGRREISRKHLMTVHGHIDKWLKSELYGISHARLKHLTTGVVAEFRDDLRNKTDLSPVTIRKVLATLHGAIEFGRERDLLSHNPAHGLKVDAKRSDGAKKIVAPSKEDVRSVIKACEGPPIKANSKGVITKRERTRKRAEHLLRISIQFSAATGLRASEQWALLWKDINFDEGRVTVSRRVDAYHIVDDPKSKAGFRDVPLSDWLLNELRQWRLRSGYAKQSDLAFANNKGSHISHDNLAKRHFKPCLNIAMVEPFGWHALRHFAISTWIENGMDLKIISTLAGHSSIMITADRYGHLFKNESRRENMSDIAKDVFA